MQRFGFVAILGFLFIITSARADTVYLDTGLALENVRIVEASQEAGGAALLLEPTGAAPGIMRGWYPSPARIVFGDKAPATEPPAKPSRAGIVSPTTGILDGAKLSLGNGEEVRLAGIAAGERDVPQSIEDIVAAQMGRGERPTSETRIWIEFDPQAVAQDGSSLGYAYLLPSGKLLNAAILASGLAKADLKTAGRAEYAALFRDAEQQARKLKRGVWNPRPSIRLSRGNLRAPAIHAIMAAPADEAVVENIIISYPPPVLRPSQMEAPDFEAAPATGAPVVFVERKGPPEKADLPPPLPRKRLKPAR